MQATAHPAGKVLSVEGVLLPASQFLAQKDDGGRSGSR